MAELKKELPKISDVLSYEDDIKPYPVIMIIAPTGSGKNYFVEQFAKKHKVLMLTSRRTKVDQTIRDSKKDDSLNLQRWIDYDDEYFMRFGDYTIPHEQRYKCTCCTYTQLEKYYKDSLNGNRNGFNPDNPMSLPQNIYDIIVVDEVHAVYTDATFASSTFYVDELIKSVGSRLSNSDLSDAEKIKTKHLILMTATPDALPESLKTMCNKIYDLTDTCYSVYPENIGFIKDNQTQMALRKAIDNSEKILYFTNYAMNRKNLALTAGVGIDKVAVLHNSELTKALMSAEDLEHMEQTDEELIKDGKYPPGVQLLAATAKLKEGLNIYEEVDVLVIQSHIMSNIVQMAGRVRKGSAKMYIVLDSPQHKMDIKENLIQQDMANTTIDAYNDMIKKKSDRDDLAATIEVIQASNPYLMYDYVSKTFKYNQAREIGIEYVRQQLDSWKQCSDYADLIKPYFPYSNIYPYIDAKKAAKESAKAAKKAAKEAKEAEKRAALDANLAILREEYFDNERYKLYTEYSKEQIQDLFDFIEQTFNYKQPNRILIHLGLKVRSYGKLKDSFIIESLESLDCPAA